MAKNEITLESLDAIDVLEMLAEAGAKKKRRIPDEVPYEQIDALLPMGVRRKWKNPLDVAVRARCHLGRDGYIFVVVTFKPGEAKEIHDLIGMGFRTVRNGVIVGGVAPQLVLVDDEQNGIMMHASLVPTEQQMQEERARSRSVAGLPVKW